MSSTDPSVTTAVDTFKFSPFLSPWRRTSCPVTPPKNGRANMKHFMMEQRPLLALKYPFLTPQQIKRKGKELWSKLSAKDKKTNAAAPSMRLPTPPKDRVCEEMGKRHFPLHLPHDEPLSMFSSPPVRSARRSLPAFPSSAAGHQGEVMSQSSRRTSGIINDDSDKMLVVRKPSREKTYADGSRWPCKITEVTDHKQAGILKRSQDARKTTRDRRVSFAEANCSPDGATSEGCHHGDDPQTNDQYMEKSPDRRKECPKSLGGHVTKRKLPFDGNTKQPAGPTANDESPAKRKINQPDWSKLNTALETEEGEDLNSDSDGERDFQLACLHGDAQPVLPHGGFVENCRQSKSRRRSCDGGTTTQNKRQRGKKPGQTGRKDKDREGDDQDGNKVHYGEGDQHTPQRKTSHQETMTSYRDDKNHTNRADAKQRVTNSITVYDMFDEADSEMIDFSHTKFSDYRENVKHSTQTTRRRTIACAGNRRPMFTRENDLTNRVQPRGKVADCIAVKYDKLREYQRPDVAASKPAKTDDRRVSRRRDSVIQSVSSPSCYNLRSQGGDETEVMRNRPKGGQEVRGRVASPKPCHELSSGGDRKQRTGYGNSKPVHPAPPGVNIQKQEQLMTPETADDIIATTLTNVTCAPRKRRAVDHDVPAVEKTKYRSDRMKGRLPPGKTLAGAELRMDRVRKRLVASVDANEQRFQTKKQKFGVENTPSGCSGRPDKVDPRVGGRLDTTPPQKAVPRHRPRTRSCDRAPSGVTPCDTDSYTQMTWQSSQQHDGISRRSSAIDKHAGSNISSQKQNRKGLCKNDDGPKVVQRFKVDSGEGHLSECVSSETVARRETRRTRVVSPLYDIKNINYQNTTCMTLSPVTCQRQSDIHNPDESTSDSMSPFPYVSPLPSSSSGVGASFWSFLSLSQQAKRLQSDLDNAMSSSDDDLPATRASVKNDVLTRAVRSMQQLTAPPGGPISPRRMSVQSPSVSGISELSQLSSLFESALQTTSPEPKGLGKNAVGSTVSGGITTREQGSTTPPVADTRPGTSPVRKRARKPTMLECQPERPVKMEPPMVEPPRAKPPCVTPPSTRPSTQGSLCDLFDDVKPGNKQIGTRRVVASLPTATGENFNELFSPGEHDIFL